MEEIKITGLGEDTSPSTDDYTVTVDMTSGVTKKLKWANLANLVNGLIQPFIHPVNSLYFTTVNENPATTFGFGTWVAYAEGAAIVGVAASGTFATPNVVVGSETVTLTYDQMPVHSHGVYDPGHSHGASPQFWRDAGGAGTYNMTSGGNRYAQGLTNVSISASGTGIGIYNAGSGQSHNNIQPSIPVYIWKRTA